MIICVPFDYFFLKIWFGNKRKYYRFRADRWDGGIATAHCAGCILRPVSSTAGN
ncbi:MAG TPA: hypothetical protein VMW53_06340 [archaeon]|nr:hypothetical protein [archaeon]